MAVGCAITGISWARVNVTLTATLDAEIGPTDTVEFRLVDLERLFPAKTTRLADGTFQIDINVTNFQDRQQVPNGTWRFVPFLNDVPGPPAGWDLDQMDRLEEASRVFIYAGNTVSYVIGFNIS